MATSHVVPGHRAPDMPASPLAGTTARRRYLMCPPEHFDVVYAINPWMDPRVTVDRRRAMAQWEELRSIYVSLGHDVLTVRAAAGLPDMVFAANAGLVVDGIGISARFAASQRQPEAARYARELRAAGVAKVHTPRFVNEGEGDLLVAGPVILAGSGFRTDARAHAEVARLTGREVVSLRLVDPRYYHLDTALCVLDDETVAYLPEAFDRISRHRLQRRFPDALLAEPTDAEVLGLNAVSDGRHVILPREARVLCARLRERGFTPVPIDFSEFRKAGGGPKCCTLELRGMASERSALPPEPGLQVPA